MVLIGALLTLAAAFSLGALVTSRIEVQPVFRFAAGAVVLSYSIFALMYTGQAGSYGMYVLCILALLPLPWVLRRITSRRPRVPFWAGIPIVIYSVLYLANAAAPEIQTDPNSYHLQSAIDAKHTGTFSKEISFYERMPHATELLFAMAFAFGGASAAKLVHLAFLFLTLFLIVCLARRLNLPEIAGYAAAVLYFCTPVVGMSSSSAFNDAALVFYVLATIIALLDERWLLAGVFAGFCYAIKMNGLLIVGIGGLWLIARRQWRNIPVFSIAAAIVIAPWMLRNVVETGNPLAPFANALFPNRYFFVATEEMLGRDLRSYGVPFWKRFFEVTAGERLQGIIGAVFWLTPIALLGLRRRPIRLIVALGAILSVPWFLNAGARFLMPSLPFLSLAITSFLPVPGCYVLAAGHAVLSWPDVNALYASRSWSLSGVPWRAALRLETEHDYLQRVSWDYRAVKMVEAATPPHAKILDLQGLHTAHVYRNFTGFWQTAEAWRLIDGLKVAQQSRPGLLYQLRMSFPEQPVRFIRLTQHSRNPTFWSISEFELNRAEARVANQSGWSLTADANRWDLPLAFDGNLTSRWSTWRGVRPGLRVNLELNSELLTGVRIFALTEEGHNAPQIEIQRLDGTWITAPSRTELVPALTLKRSAMYMLKKNGFTHIVVRAAPLGIGLLGESMVNNPEQWQVNVVGTFENVYVLKIL